MHANDAVDFGQIALQAPVAWSVLDLDGRQVLGNEVYARLFGYDAREMATLTVDDLTHPEDRDATSDYLAALISGDVERFEIDKRYVRKNGSVFVGHLVASVLHDADGSPVGLVGFIEDVTEARAMADALARSEERLGKMLTNISDTVTLVDADGTIRATTGTRTAILGYPRGFWDHTQIFDLVHPDERAEADEMAARVLAEPGNELTGEFRVRHHLGHYEEIEVAAVNLLEDASVGAVVMTTRNITERKATEREMLEMRDAAVALAEQRAAFVANVSHELRTPLHAVLGLAELLSESDMPDAQHRFVDGIKTEAHRLRQTVDDLLDYARIEADGVVLEPSAVDVRLLVDRVAERARRTEFGAGLAVETDVDERVPGTVDLDEHRVDQILTNLMGNAVKFTSEGSVRLRVHCTDDLVVFEVRDSGPGIPETYRQRIFDPFTQVPGSSAVGGTGLGLALVRGLVTLMAGAIDVESDPSRGSTFRVGLPRGESHPVTADAAVSATPTWRPPETAARVLVVEDNEVNRMLVSQQLERLGHDAVIVATATEAIEMLVLDEHGFDIVLMDWQLPDLDGLEATRRVRRSERGARRVPILAVTASAMPEDRAACRAAGMDGFLPKPVSMADLRGAIARWMPGREVPEPRPSMPVVDESILDALVGDLESRPLVESLVDRYLTELGSRRLLLDRAYVDADVETLHRVGHTLRSTSEMLGATALAATCRLLEAASATTDLDRLMSEFGNAADAAEIGLGSWRARTEVVR